MSAKEYLQKLRYIDAWINAIIETVSRHRELLSHIRSIDTTADKVQVSHRSQMETTIIKIADLERDLNKKIDELVNLKRNAMEKIDCLADNDHKLLLTARYINMKSWEEIAVDMCYTYQWVHRLHGRALQEFDKILKS